MGYAREINCSPFAPTKLRYRTEESSPRSLEPFEPTTHSSSHSKYGKSLCSVPGCQSQEIWLANLSGDILTFQKFVDQMSSVSLRIVFHLIKSGPTVPPEKAKLRLHPYTLHQSHFIMEVCAAI
ncbi:hypothetical protein TNCV_3757241 [Trichonephila clavipes]|nr:hypothetical protein TNCV_3757241 [Trichonephila clavipes]